VSSPVAIESEGELVANAVRELARRTRFPVAFGGLIEEGVVSVTSIVGNRTRALDGLRVRPERGLGGRAMMELRPRMTSDYGSSQQITHDYDVFVLGEGLRTLLALPIVVQGRPRGVLYAGAWDEEQVGGVTTAPAMQVAQSVADELRIRDEVQRRLRTASAAGEAGVAAPQREELRESFAELRSIAASVDDAELRARIALVERRLVTLAGDAVPAATGPVPTVHLSRRETDVLACAALGSTNAEIASQLGLREGTVKAYLGTAMSKLDASTRRARRAGLLP
jgi:DNA-binding CsgD family transcriptional regulator